MKNRIAELPDFNISRQLKSKDGYKSAMSRIEALMDAEANTPESEELERLVEIVEAYEDGVYGEWLEKCGGERIVLNRKTEGE